MARKRKGLAQTAAGLAAAALLEKAIQKAMEDPRVRRKAKAIGKSLKKRAKAVGKKISKAVRKGAVKAGRAAPRRRNTRTSA